MKKCSIVDTFSIEAENLFCIHQYESVKNSGAVLSSEITGAIIEACRKNFDYIIIDSSPLGLVADAQILQQYSDAVVLTVREDWAQIGAINDSIDTIKNNGKDFVGIVLNSSKSIDTTQGYAYTYRNYYGKYSKYSRYANQS